MAPSPIREVARLFLTLGALGFGGPAAHIALMRGEVVRRRGWVDDREFLDMVGAANLIPGPNSTELAIHLGHRRAGPRGAGGGRGVLHRPGGADRRGARLAVRALWHRPGGDRPPLRDPAGDHCHRRPRPGGPDPQRRGRRRPAVVAAAAFGTFLAGIHELAILVAAGVVMALWAGRHRLGGRLRSVWLMPVLMADAAGPAPVTLWRLFLVVLEIGSVLYGSGYVLLAFLQRNLVDELGGLTSDKLLDAVAVGQVTPGPVFTTATFVGWQVDGPAGAAVATVGIFLPSFVFVALLGRIVPWMRARPVARAFLGGVTLASLGLMAGVLVRLVDVALVDVPTVVVAAAALGVLLATRLNSAWLIGAGALIGVLHAVLA